MIRVIDNQSYDHTPNWTPLVPITIFNQAKTLFQVLFTTTRFSSVLSCEDLLISSLHRSGNVWIFIYLKSSITWMFICTQFIDQLPVGLLAQLVERCTGIAEVMGSNPVRAWIFFQVLFTTTRFSCVLSCEDLLISHMVYFSCPN